MSPSLAPNRVKGIGLHSGQPVEVDLQLAPAGAGITFSLNGKKIAARLENLKETRRGTSLAGIAVVEHFLSAAYSLGYYDLEVSVQGDELPALDGSALPWVVALEKLGLPAKKTVPFLVGGSFSVSDANASLSVSPYNGFKVDFVVNFEGLGEQRFLFDAAKHDYKAEIAPARTFGYLEEYEALKKNGLALGAGYDNALILSRNGYVNEPRFPDELVRHKILDLIGDLALLGQPIKGSFQAVRSGHRLNCELLRRLLQNG